MYILPSLNMHTNSSRSQSYRHALAGSQNRQESYLYKNIIVNKAVLCAHVATTTSFPLCTGNPSLLECQLKWCPCHVSFHKTAHLTQVLLSTLCLWFTSFPVFSSTEKHATCRKTSLLPF